MINLSHHRLDLNAYAPGIEIYDQIERGDKEWFVLESPASDFSKPPKFLHVRSGKMVSIPLRPLRLSSTEDVALAALAVIGLSAGAGITPADIHIASGAPIDKSVAGSWKFYFGMAFTKAPETTDADAQGS